MSVHAEAEGGGRGRGSMLTPRRACAITGGLCGALDSLSRATLLSGAEDERDRCTAAGHMARRAVASVAACF